MPSRKDFSEIEIEEIISLFNKGCGAKKIAIKLKVSVSPIRRILKSLGLKHPKGYVNPSPKATFTEQNLLDAEKLFNQDYGVPSIAKMIGISESAVKNALEKLNLKHPKGWRNTKSQPWRTPDIKYCKNCNKKMNKSEFSHLTKSGKIETEAFCGPCRREKRLNKYKQELSDKGMKVRNKNNNELSEEELIKIELLFKQGYNRKRISEEIGRTIHAVKKGYKKLNLCWRTFPRKIKSSSIIFNKRIKSDPSYKKRHEASYHISYAIYRFLNGKSYNPMIFNHLPYTLEEMINHIESLFEPWMNWKNRGRLNSNRDHIDSSTWTWQIDHINPHSDFLYTDFESKEFLDCWALSNLRPLDSRQNAADGAHRTRHIKKVKI